MKIYTGQTSGDKLEKIKKLDMGIMISSNPNSSPIKAFGEVTCCIDNGSFSAFSKGYSPEISSEVFMTTLKKCFKLGIKLDMVVAPDIVCGGNESLDYSYEWSRTKLIGTPNLALVVQDGMSVVRVEKKLKPFSHIFIGGSVRWKWENAEMWTKFAREHDKKIHIGQCGRLSFLKRARELGVDSVDSTSFTVNDSFHIVENYICNHQLEMEL